jgi:hypothetical protein
VVGVDADPEDRDTQKLLYDAICDGTIDLSYGQVIGATFHVEEILADAKYALFTDTLSAEFEEKIRAYIADATVTTTSRWVAVVDSVKYESNYKYFTYSHALDENYVMTQSTIDNGTVVMVTYSKTTVENGVEVTKTTKFLLNFNIFNVNVRLENGEVIPLEKYGYYKLESEN